MIHYSVFDLFNIGIGPSSSHTVGPMRAAKRFLDQVKQSPQIGEIAHIKCFCFGSLAATGKGHGTDIAVLMGLLGSLPESVDPKTIPSRLRALRESQLLPLTEDFQIPFNPDIDVDLSNFTPLPLHPNGMHFIASNKAGEPVVENVIYSTGGGFIASEEELKHPNGQPLADYPYPYTSAHELVSLALEYNVSISDIVLANELALRPEKDVRRSLKHIWDTMKKCIASGLSASGVLPGPLQVPRRAKALRKSLLARGESQLQDPLSILDWVNLYAIAVNEENAAGGRIVTAPTNGAAGIVPAVLNYATKFCSSPYPDPVDRFLLTAGGIAILYKKNASISGADVGCQGEVGVACSMAAAALTEYLGGTPQQVENAAEIGIEHNLGLTCDPVGGLVQIPCIERNAIAAVKALNAARIALRGNGSHFVPLDKAIRTMLDTGRDMQSKYKETALGGLAVNVVNC
jgi:L-serine dehydratase